MKMRQTLGRSRTAKGGRTSSVKGRQRKAQRMQRTKSGLDQRQPPPGQGRRGTGGKDDFDRVVAVPESIRKTLENLVFVTSPFAPQELHPSWNWQYPRIPRPNVGLCRNPSVSIPRIPTSSDGPSSRQLHAAVCHPAVPFWKLGCPWEFCQHNVRIESQTETAFSGDGGATGRKVGTAEGGPLHEVKVKFQTQ